MPRGYQLTRRGMGVLALVLLVISGVVIVRRARFIERSVVAQGQVTWNSRWTLGVTPEQERYPVLVSKPLVYWFFRPGESVRIRYDPQRHVPGSVLAYGRIDSFAGLWLGPLLLALLTLIALNGAVAPHGAERVRVNIAID